MVKKAKDTVGKVKSSGEAWAGRREGEEYNSVTDDVPEELDEVARNVKKRCGGLDVGELSENEEDAKKAKAEAKAVEEYKQEVRKEKKLERKRKEEEKMLDRNEMALASPGSTNGNTGEKQVYWKHKS